MENLTICLKFETPSWCKDKKEFKNKNIESNWCEYLMWEIPRDKDGNILSGHPEKGRNE